MTESSDREFLLDLAAKLRHVPAIYGTDDYHVDRLEALAVAEQRVGDDPEVDQATADQLGITIEKLRDDEQFLDALRGTHGVGKTTGILYADFKRYVHQHRDLQTLKGLQHCSETADPTDVLHGTGYLFGTPFHLTCVRIKTNDEGYDAAINENYDQELEHLYAISGDGPFMTVELPGYEGRYVAYAYPHTR